MAHIFLSYSSKHRDLTRQLAAAIEADGYTVWWDRDLESWGSYQKQIRDALDAARVVVVIWSEGARASDYVYAEARRAFDDGKLVNVCAPDFPMREIPEPMSVSHIDAVTDHSGILATIASVWSGTPIKTRVPYHELFFGRCGRRLLDAKRKPLNRHLEEVNPSELLQAVYEVVPFVDVAGRKAEVLAWCRLGTRATVGRLIHGPGGLGKTRLMIDVAAALASDGWLAGFLDRPPDKKDALQHLRENALDQLISVGDEPGVLIVMDYAEGRRNEIDWLVKKLDARPRDETRLLRLVLLARSAGGWWHDLHDKTDEIGRVFRRPLVVDGSDAEVSKQARIAGRFGDVIGLELIPTGQARVDFFHASVQAFAPVVRAIGWPACTGSEPNPQRLMRYRHEPAFARPLALQMEALLYLGMAEVDPDLVGIDAVLDKVLGLERKHWSKLIGALDGEREHDLRRGISQITAVAGVASQDAATELLMRDRHYKREAPDHVRPVLSGLTRIYGTGKGGIVPLEPDLIGEHEVATTADVRLVDACLDWIATLPDAEQSRRRKDLVTVLQRATLPEHGDERAGKAAGLLEHLLRHRGQELAAELIAVVIDTPGALGEIIGTHLDSLDDETLESLDNALPLQSLALMDLSLRIAERRDQLARSLKSAADAAEELAEDHKIAVLSDLAARSGTLSVRLSNLGRREDALAASQEAVDIYRRLAQARPDAFLPDLATSISVTSDILFALDRHAEAATAARQALETLLPFVQRYPDTYEGLAKTIAADLIRYSAAAGVEPDPDLLLRAARALRLPPATPDEGSAEPPPPP
ncbi:MAG: TIR domain-containing protein [Xanthobacteraceae bacterium]